AINYHAPPILAQQYTKSWRTSHAIAFPSVPPCLRVGCGARFSVPQRHSCRCKVPALHMTTLTHLECGLCHQRHDAARLQNLCSCGGPLLARYDLAKVRSSWNREWIPNGPSSMWRYAAVLPVSKPNAIV